LRKWQTRIRIKNAIERNLATALSVLDRMASGMGLSKNGKRNAAMIYRKAVSQNLVRGEPYKVLPPQQYMQRVDSVMCHEALMRLLHPPNLSERNRKNYRFISRKLGLKLLPTSPGDYVSRFAAN